MHKVRYIDACTSTHIIKRVFSNKTSETIKYVACAYNVNMRAYVRCLFSTHIYIYTHTRSNNSARMLQSASGARVHSRALPFKEADPRNRISLDDIAIVRDNYSNYLFNTHRFDEFEGGRGNPATNIIY